MAEKANPDVYKKDCGKTSYSSALSDKGVSNEYLKQICYKKNSKLLIIKKYWFGSRIAELDPRWRQPVFDFYVQSGSHGIKFFQKVLGVEADGFIGPKTIQESFKKDSILHINMYLNYRAKFLRSRKIYKEYTSGMENRIRKNEKQTMKAILLYDAKATH